MAAMPGNAPCFGFAFDHDHPFHTEAAQFGGDSEPARPAADNRYPAGFGIQDLLPALKSSKASAVISLSSALQ